MSTNLVYVVMMRESEQQMVFHRRRQSRTSFDIIYLPHYTVYTIHVCHRDRRTAENAAPHKALRPVDVCIDSNARMILKHAVIAMRTGRLQRVHCWIGRRDHLENLLPIRDFRFTVGVLVVVEALVRVCIDVNHGLSRELRLERELRANHRPHDQGGKHVFHPEA